MIIFQTLRDREIEFCLFSEYLIKYISEKIILRYEFL